MSILQEYFDNKLVEAGFPSGLKIEYSLSYCQGDGVAFYGRLDWDDWVNLYKRMNPEKTEKEYRRFAFLCEYLADNEHFNDVEIIGNRFSYHYAHWNTMELDANDAEYFEFAHIHRKDKVVFSAIWNEFIEDLATYIQDTSRELESLGYRIIDAAYIDHKERTKTVETKHYRLNFTVEPVQFYDGFYDPEDFGYDNINDFCEAVMSGMKIVDLRATVYHKTLGVEMGENSLSWCEYVPNDTTYGGNKRYLVHEAICAARAFARQAVQVSQSLRSTAIN